MIKKISQLNPLPLSAYQIESEEFWSEEDRRRYEEMLFEVSYQTADDYDPRKADEIDYYTSYSITLSGVNEALRIPELCSAISSILEGGLSVISGNCEIGTPNGSLTDFVDTVPTDSEHRLTIYSKTNVNNALSVHGKLETHNNVSILGTGAAFRCQANATFDQLINGVAYRAQWGDLAEYYSADDDYEPGTLIKFGGEKEITVATDKVNGVVTTKPGVILNGIDGIEKPTAIALVGRVPIKVRGPVRKFDKIVLSHTDPGIGVVYNFAPYSEIIGRALEENKNTGEKLVMCATRFNIG